MGSIDVGSITHDISTIAGAGYIGLIVTVLVCIFYVIKWFSGRKAAMQQEQAQNQKDQAQNNQTNTSLDHTAQAAEDDLENILKGK